MVLSLFSFFEFKCKFGLFVVLCYSALHTSVLTKWFLLLASEFIVDTIAYQLILFSANGEVPLSLCQNWTDHDTLLVEYVFLN